MFLWKGRVDVVFFRTQNPSVKRYLGRFAEVVALLILVAILCWAFLKVVDYILPFVVGAFFAVMLLPLVRLLEHRGVHRTAAVITVLASIVLLLLAISTYVVIAVAREATMWTQTITAQFGLIQSWFTQQISLGKAMFGHLPPTIASELNDTAKHAVSNVQTVFSGFAAALIQAVTHLPDSMFVTVIALITTYFMLVNRDKMYNSFLKTLPPGWSDKVRVVTNDMMKAFGGTIRAQVVLMLMSAVLGIIGMWLEGIPYAVILGILFGVSGLVPILGSAILTVPWAIGALVIGDVPLGIKVLLLQLAISLIRHVVEPKILADSVGLDTLSTLFAMYVGMKLMGLLGLFFGPIVLIGIKSLLRIRLFMDFFPELESGPQPPPNAPCEEREGAVDHSNNTPDPPLSDHPVQKGSTSTS
jgi:sporulation integral membrane protein YtvI